MLNVGSEDKQYLQSINIYFSAMLKRYSPSTDENIKSHSFSKQIQPVPGTHKLILGSNLG